MNLCEIGDHPHQIATGEREHEARPNESMWDGHTTSDMHYLSTTHVWLGPLRVKNHEQVIRTRTRARTNNVGSADDMLGGERCATVDAQCPTGVAAGGMAGTVITDHRSAVSCYTSPKRGV